MQIDSVSGPLAVHSVHTGRCNVHVCAYIRAHKLHVSNDEIFNNNHNNDCNVVGVSVSGWKNGGGC